MKGMNSTRAHIYAPSGVCPPQTPQGQARLACQAAPCPTRSRAPVCEQRSATTSPPAATLLPSPSPLGSLLSSSCGPRQRPPVAGEAVEVVAREVHLGLQVELAKALPHLRRPSPRPLTFRRRSQPFYQRGYTCSTALQLRTSKKLRDPDSLTSSICGSRTRCERQSLGERTGGSEESPKETERA